MSDFQPYLQLSQTGHLIDDICERGFEQLHTLAVSGHYDHVMECLICLTPLFAEDEGADSIPVGSTEMLTSSSSFMSAIENIVNADQTYFKMAKDLLISDFPGPVLKELGNMLAKQIYSHRWYGFRNMDSIILLWLKVFVKIPNWNTTKTTLYMVDVLCNHILAMLKNDPECAVFPSSKDIFKSAIKVVEENDKASNQGGFLSWVSGNRKSSYFSTLLYPSCATEFPNFAFFALQAEEELETFSDLWDSLSVSYTHLTLPTILLV